MKASEVLADIHADYAMWRKEIISLIERSKYQAALNVNAELLALYWKIGSDIIEKQEQLGWGTQVIAQLSKDLSKTFPDDKGYSERNLRNMKRFAKEYPHFPFLQVPLAEIQENPIWQVPLAKYVKAPEDKPTIGLLLCRSKSDTKARFALRGITQPLGIAQYETEQLFADVASSLPQVEDMEMEGQE